MSQLRIYLVGYMYSGKTTYGRRIAQELGLNFLDTDRVFVDRYHYTVPIFFQRFGEEAFRKLETEVLHSTATMNNIVIATGGGMPCYGDNMDFIQRNGTSVYIQMPVEVLLERCMRSRNPRPAMQGLTEEQRRQKIIAQLAIREPYYLRATQIIDGTKLCMNAPLNIGTE